jgi:hypothetical protein
MWGALMFMLLICGYLVYALQAGSNASRRNIFLMAAAIGSVLVWAMMDMGWQFLYQVRGLSDEDFSSLASGVESVTAILATLIIGILLWVMSRANSGSMNGAGLRILVGVSLCFLAIMVMIVLAGQNNPAFLAGFVIFAIGEALFAPAMHAVVWQVSPQRVRGTAFGLMLSATYISSVLASIFIDRNYYIEGEEISTLLPISGIVFFGLSAIAWGFVAYLMLRNYKLEPERPFNPFE